MDLKALEKLAKACRKAGIKHYKDAQLEFTLSDEPYRQTRTRKAKNPQVKETDESTMSLDGLTEEQILMWSAGDNVGEAS